MPLRIIRSWISRKDKTPKKPEVTETTHENIKETLQEEHSRLVVVGKESQFTDKIINYAIDMAKNMGYEIVAVSTAPLLACDTLNRLSHHKDKVCIDFEKIAKEAVRAFQRRAEENSLKFRHIIKFNATYEVLTELKHELGGFEFVVSEEEGQSDEIFVYSLL